MLRAECRKRITYVGNLEIVAFCNPCGEQVVIGDKVAALIRTHSTVSALFLRKQQQIIICPVGVLQDASASFSERNL